MSSGGTVLPLRAIFDLLYTSLAPYYGNNDVTLVEESYESGDETKTHITELDFIGRAVASTLADKWADKEEVDAALKASGYDWPEQSYPKEAFALIRGVRRRKTRKTVKRT